MKVYSSFSVFIIVICVILKMLSLIGITLICIKTVRKNCVAFQMFHKTNDCRNIFKYIKTSKNQSKYCEKNL